MTSNDDIMRVLGRLEESVSRIREDVREEKQNAQESRDKIHRRLDEQAQQIAKLETTVAISGQVDAQMRDQIAALKETVESNHEEVSPTLAEWKRMKTIGAGISSLIALGGLTIGAILIWLGDVAVQTIRAWLRIP